MLVLPAHVGRQADRIEPWSCGTMTGLSNNCGDQPVSANIYSQQSILCLRVRAVNIATESTLEGTNYQPKLTPKLSVKEVSLSTMLIK